MHIPRLSFRRSLFILLVGLCAGSCGPRGVGQESAPTATLRVNTQLVVLDIVVTDGADKPVSGLRAEDFQVFQDGVEQKISHFEKFSPDTSIVSATKDRNGHDDWGDATKTILVLDELNTPWEQMAYSREEVGRFLHGKTGLLAGPTMLMYVNDLGFHPMGVYTRDRQALMEELNAHRPRLPDKLTRGAGGELLAQSFSMLQQIAISTRGEKGRKVVLWIGKGFPSINVKALLDKDEERFKAAIRYTTDLLLDSRVTVYKLEPTDAEPPASDVGPDGEGGLSDEFEDPSLENFNFNSFVVQTGGRYFYGRNDLDAEVSESSGEGTSYYTLTYTPSSKIKASNYHGIRVVMRDRNLRAWTKQGYYPPSVAAPHSGKKQLGFELYEAAVSGMSYSGIGVRAEGCRQGAPLSQVTCQVWVDTSSVSLDEEQSGGRSASLVLVLVGLDAKGKIVNTTEREFISEIPIGDSRSLANGRFNIQFKGELGTAVHTARLIVRDSAGKIGTFDIPAGTTGHLFSKN